MTMSDEKFLWQFFMTILDDNFWQYLTILAIFYNLITYDNWDNWDNWDNFEKTVLQTCDIWDTGYSSDNWEPEYMTIFGTGHLIVTLDSIRNSCDVLFIHAMCNVFMRSKKRRPRPKVSVLFYCWLPVEVSKQTNKLRNK